MYTINQAKLLKHFHSIFRYSNIKRQIQNTLSKILKSKKYELKVRKIVAKSLEKEGYEVSALYGDSVENDI